MSKNRFQILSIDGGGIKGLFSAAVLAKFEQDLNTRIVDHFDLVTGTSTGGIIALGLAYGLSPKEIVEFYVYHANKIFKKRWFHRFRKVLSTRYSPKPLKNALKECFGEATLAYCNRPVIIPSYNLTTNEAYLFKTPHHSRFTRDYNVPLWKVAMATSAAPTYFPTFKSIDSQRLVDGGFWANNPDSLGVTEAYHYLGIELNSIKLLSLGTTSEASKSPENLDTGGLFQWRKKGIQVSFDGQSEGSFNQAMLLIGRDSAYRLNPTVHPSLFQLDKTNVDELMGAGAHVSRHYTPMMKNQFIDHTAHSIPFNQKSEKHAR